MCHLLPALGLKKSTLNSAENARPDLCNLEGQIQIAKEISVEGEFTEIFQKECEEISKKRGEKGKIKSRLKYLHSK